MTIECPECGHGMPDGEMFCGQCGRRLDGRTSPQEERDPLEADYGYYYTYSCFGVVHRYTKRAWDFGIIITVAAGLVVAILFLGAGLWANAILFFLAMCFVAFMYHMIGKRKYGAAALFAVAFFVAVPGMVIATFPWQAWHEDYLEDKYTPEFSASITYDVVDDTHVVCDGNVTNYGRTGSMAVVEFRAYSGPSEDISQYQPDIEWGVVVTEWVAPDGGVAHVHWECDLDYFNWGGSVTWTVEPYG